MVLSEPAPKPGAVARLRLWAVAAGLVVLTLALLPLQLLAIRCNWTLARRLPHLWHRAAAPLIGIRLRRRGAPVADRPLLLVSNHQSWADIVALGAAMPLCFVAKSEVRGWGPFGWLARLQRTVFVSRTERRDTGRQANEIGRRLAEGDAMVLFAEGTTSDGNRVLPFRTALFGALQRAATDGERTVFVQPVSVAWTRANGMAMGVYGRPLAAWPGDVPLLPHLPRFLLEGALDVEVSFGEPIAVGPRTNRKHLAAATERAVARLLSESLRDPL